MPVIDREGRVRAVLDIDSAETGTFDSVDRINLECLVSQMKDLAWD